MHLLKPKRYTNYLACQKIRQDFQDGGVYSGGMNVYACVLKLVRFNLISTLFNNL